MSSVIAVLFTAIFVFDVLTPLGLPVSVFYVVPLALTFKLPRREAPYWLAGASSAATVVDYLLSSSPSGIPSWLPASNRAISVALLWAMAAVIRRQQDIADHLIHVAALEAENRAHLEKQQVLQRQAEEIQDLYNRAPCGYHSLDATGRYVAVNDTELQWLGYRREDLIGHTRFRDFLVPQSARRFDEVFPRFVAQGSIHDLELDLVQKDGSLLPISLSATAIRDSEGRYLVSRSTIVDITERRRTEEALRVSESESRFREMANVAPAMLWITERDGSASFISRGWYEFTGQTEQEGFGEDGFGWLDAVHPEDRDRSGRIFLEANDKRQPFTLDYRVRRHDGKYHWAIDAGRPRFGLNGEFLGYIGSVLDITERKQAEEALRASEEQFRAVFNQTTGGIAQTDLTGRFTLVNDRYCEIVGRSREELLALRIHDITHPSDVSAHMEKFHALVQGGPSFVVEKRYLRPDGSLVWVHNDIAAVRDSHGQVLQAVAAVTDITERKELETLLINKNKDLEALLYVTSHDLKEPLRAIESFSQLVVDRYVDRIDANGADYLRRIVRATQRLDRLLNDILDLSRLQRMVPPMEEVEAEALVKEALTRLDNRIKETGASVQIISPLPRLRVNRMWATQGLYNLLANAMKFTLDGHPPDIEIASYEVPASATPFAGVVVKDRGPGVPTRHAERIFMLFQRAVGRDVEGTGAGLTIVRQVAERHGGRAWVQPRAGGGSEFVITFANSTHNGNGGASPT